MYICTCVEQQLKRTTQLYHHLMEEQIAEKMFATKQVQILERLTHTLVRSPFWNISRSDVEGFRLNAASKVSLPLFYIEVTNICGKAPIARESIRSLEARSQF